MARAKASRIVTHESRKWRSGRDGERVVDFRADGRGGKAPCSFSGEEGEGGEGHGDMVVPASEAAALEVVEAEFVFEILVEPFGTPPLLDQVDDLDEGHALVGDEVKVAGLRVAIPPLADEPHPLTLARLMTVIGGGDHAEKSEAGAKRFATALTPGDGAERIGGGELAGEIAGSDGLIATPAKGVDDPDPRRATDGDLKVEPRVPDGVKLIHRSL